VTREHFAKLNTIFPLPPPDFQMAYFGHCLKYLTKCFVPKYSGQTEGHTFLKCEVEGGKMWKNWLIWHGMTQLWLWFWLFLVAHKINQLYSFLKSYLSRHTQTSGDAYSITLFPLLTIQGISIHPKTIYTQCLIWYFSSIFPSDLHCESRLGSG